MQLFANRKRPIIFSIFGAMALIMLFLFGRSIVERSFHLIQRPLLAAGTWIYRQTVPADIADLQNKISDLGVDAILFEQLKKENTELKEALGFIQRQSVQAISAAVTSRSHSNQQALFSIDRGERDGVSVGDPVIVKDGVLIGKVISVSPASATVQALVDGRSAIAVGILGLSQTIGVGEGMAQNLLRLKFIPQDTSLSVNDLVVTSGLEANIPPGLFVGMINDVRPEPNAPFLEAVIQPAVDVRQFTIVHVLVRQTL